MIQWKCSCSFTFITTILVATHRARLLTFELFGLGHVTICSTKWRQHPSWTPFQGLVPPATDNHGDTFNHGSESRLVIRGYTTHWAMHSVIGIISAVLVFSSTMRIRLLTQSINSPVILQKKILLVVNASSIFLWNSAPQVTYYSNLAHITYPYHCENLKKELRSIRDLTVDGSCWENLRSSTTLFSLQTQSLMLQCFALLLCYSFFYFPKWNKNGKRYNKIKSTRPF